jgi:hypothetical protein
MIVAPGLGDAIDQRQTDTGLHFFNRIGMGVTHREAKAVQGRLNPECEVPRLR